MEHGVTSILGHFRLGFRLVIRVRVCAHDYETRYWSRAAALCLETPLTSRLTEVALFQRQRLQPRAIYCRVVHEP